MASSDGNADDTNDDTNDDTTDDTTDDIAGRPEGPPDRLTVGIVGGSGYAGGEVLRIALQHPRLEVVQVTSERHAGQPIGNVHPNLRGLSRLRFTALDALEPCDVLIAALPHGAFLERYDRFSRTAPRLVDLSSDLRLNDPEVYLRTYGWPHPRPELLGTFVYGVPELNRARLRGATRISGAGCIATASELALAPFLRHAILAKGDAIVDAKIGSSAAGARPGPSGHHPERAGAIRTYAPVGHRHEPEIAQALGGRLRIHLTATAVERVRGILVAAHLFVQDGTSEQDVLMALRESYEDEPFVRLVLARRGIHRVPDPRVLDGSNWCDIGFGLDRDSGRLVVMSAIDNLVKGTAGQAIQALNVSVGWDERSGLSFPGLHP